MIFWYLQAQATKEFVTAILEVKGQMTRNLVDRG